MASNSTPATKTLTIVPGPIIIGAGPSGLAVAACLHSLSIPSLLIEKSDTIANLWHNSTSDRLALHLPKHLCQLPHLPFPPHFPTYPSKSQFLSYLHSYSRHFRIHPVFRTSAVSTRFDAANSLWHVATESLDDGSSRVEYVGRWLVVATGENAVAALPEGKGREGFKGSVVHSSGYRNGGRYEGERVLVVGCGNSGMEVCLDLWEHGALPSMSVRSGVHVLPREMLGTSTFELAMKLLNWLPLKLVDRFLLMMTKMMVGDAEKCGLKRPKVGPLELKMTTGKTPVLDVGALSLIKKGSIRIVPEVESFTSNGAKFVDGTELEFNSVIFATGYRSNVASWLKDCDFFTKEGKPKASFPDGWKGKNGLYCVGFTGKGLLGISSDARNIACDIAGGWKKKL